jgi:aspartyl/asparaginyl-tRNA synthetase
VKELKNELETLKDDLNEERNRREAEAICYREQIKILTEQLEKSEPDSDEDEDSKELKNAKETNEEDK